MRISLMACMGIFSCMYPMELPMQKELTLEQQLRNRIYDYILKKENEYIKESWYRKPGESKTGNVLVLPPFSIEKEVQAGIVCIAGNKGILCADNKLFITALHNLSARPTIVPLAGRIEIGDQTPPAVSAVCYTSCFSGAEGECVLLGENNGRIRIVDLKKPHEIKTFGVVAGKVLAMLVNEKGNQLAVHFAKKNEYAEKDVEKALTFSAFALANAYTKRSVSHIPKLSRNGSWYAGQRYNWTALVPQATTSALKTMRFEGNEEAFVVEMANGSTQKWIMSDIENNPQLAKVNESRIENNPELAKIS